MKFLAYCPAALLHSHRCFIKYGNTMNNSTMLMTFMMTVCIAQQDNITQVTHYVYVLPVYGTTSVWYRKRNTKIRDDYPVKVDKCKGKKISQQRQVGSQYFVLVRFYQQGDSLKLLGLHLLGGCASLDTIFVRACHHPASSMVKFIFT